MRIEWYDSTPRDAFDAAAPQGYPPEPAGPTARSAIAWRGSEPVARLATYLAVDLHGAPGTTGMIGHYGALDSDAGIALIRAAAGELFSSGADRILGPINGSTWARYRLALPPTDPSQAEPPFLSEPQNPPDYPLHFERAGFAAIAHYESRIARDLSLANPRAQQGLRETRARGLVIEPLRIDRFEEELRELYDLSLVAFADNPYYSPIRWDEFQAMYMPLRDRLDPELVLLARAADGALAGFALCYADLLALRDGRPYRVIAKTLASAPEWRGVGLGGLLLDEIRRLSREKGYAALIFALMHVTNPSSRIAGHTAGVFREYVLYGLAAAGDG